MKKQFAVDSRSGTGRLTVLLVSPVEEDHVSLRMIVGHSKWILFHTRDLASTLETLAEHEIAVLICEANLLKGTWTDVLEKIRFLPEAPSLIVTSGRADEHLWAEALSLGAWDVLAKPFDRIEVIRSIQSAWQHWHDKASMPAPVKRMTAEG
jgi:DNA-binding NtrC family response regulator